MWTTLLVEDELQAREYVKALFGKIASPFRIAGEAANGSDALAYIRKHNPDLVISDIVMPVMDGVELLQAVRTEGFDTRFVMLTCMSDFEYARSALEHGATSYLLKLSMDAEALELTLDKVARELRLRGRLRKIERELQGIAKHAAEPTDHPELNAVIDRILQHYDEPLSLASLAEWVSMDPSYLSDLFRKKTSVTLTNFLQNVRIESAKVLLTETSATIGEIAERVGFANDNYFNKIFRKWTGVSPGDYRRNADDNQKSF
ncbi:helix-turn-helix domain-containing protein [Paenibacillus hodogayensis]|uniref:Helix-turn-helix domain-containing protein n=1 Tax=Paenibacillus hodogayensis TaxID=279208 RepID=A0ABV5W6J3_9BACL